MKRWHVVVVVPARNEETSVVRCVRSINRATWLVRPFASVDVIVVADSCTDQTACRALAVGSRVCVLELDLGCVGAARHFGVAAGLRRSSIDPRRVWVANTDADSSVPVLWLLRQLVLGWRGFVAVAGLVHLERSTNRDLQTAFLSSYTRRVDGTHDHVHGANLGVRADAYCAAGGWSRTVATGEDHDLWNRLQAVGPTMPSSSVYVVTSARTTGRAPAGFAAHMAAHEAALVGGR